MAEPLRRAKLGDLAAAAGLLAVFGLVPFALLVADRSRVDTKGLLTAYAVCLGISWPTLLVGGLPLAFFWRKDRKVDKVGVSTLGTGELRVVLLSVFCVCAGGLLLLGAEIIELVDVVRAGVDWTVIINGVAIALVVWIVLLVARVGFQVRAVRRGVIEAELEPAEFVGRKVSMTGQDGV